MASTGSGMYNLELFVLVEVEQVDLAQGVEIVARARQNSHHGVLDLDARHEPATSFAPPTLRWAPGGTVVPPPFAVGALPEGRVPDRNGPQASSPLGRPTASSAGRRSAPLSGSRALCRGRPVWHGRRGRLSPRGWVGCLRPDRQRGWRGGV